MYLINTDSRKLDKDTIPSEILQELSEAYKSVTFNSYGEVGPFCSSQKLRYRMLIEQGVDRDMVLMDPTTFEPVTKTYKNVNTYQTFMVRGINIDSNLDVRSIVETGIVLEKNA